MALINFFLERYNLKEFFSFEIKLFYIVKDYHNYLFFKYGKISSRVQLILELFLFLIVFFKFSDYFVIFFIIIIIKNYLKLTFGEIILIKQKNILLQLQVFFARFKSSFLLLFLKFFFILKFLFRPFTYFILFLDLFFFKCYCIYKPKFFKSRYVFLFNQEFFLKLFFNLQNPVNVPRFLFLVNNTFFYFILNPLKRIHYKLMSIPMEKPNGAVKVSWLAYAAPVKLYFFLIRWSYYSGLDKKFNARHYYREKMVVSYIKNFVYLCLFFLNKISLFLKNISNGLFLFLIKLKKSFYLNVFNLYGKSWNYVLFVFIDVFKRFFIVVMFFLIFFFFCSIFKLYFLNIFYVLPKLFEKPFRVYFLIRLFFYKLKLKIIDRIWFVPRFVSFGRGVKFKKRFSRKDFRFIYIFWYWTTRDFSGRFQFFYKFKKFSIRKRRAAFKLVFKFFFIFKYFYFFLNFFFIFIEYIFFYPIFWLFLKIVWAYFADLCFVF